MLDINSFIKKRVQFLSEFVFTKRDQMKYVIAEHYWNDNQSQREEIDQGLQKILQFKPQFSLNIKEILKSDELNEANLTKITEVLKQIITSNYVSLKHSATLLLAKIFSKYKGTDTDLMLVI